MKLFEVNQQRVQQLNKNRWVDFIMKNCSRALSAKTSLVRGSDHEYSVVVVRPSASARGRESISDSQALMSWIDNDVTWSNYPKRSMSTFMSTGDEQEFGQHTYVVLPFDNSRLALCPGDDINLDGSFVYASEKYDINDYMIGRNIEQEIRKLYKMLVAIDSTKFNQPIDEDSYRGIMYVLKSVDGILNNGHAGIEYLYNKYEEANRHEPTPFASAAIKSEQAVKTLRDALSPVNNKYHITTVSGLPHTQEPREVWTSDPIVLVNADLWDDIRAEIEERQ